MKEMHPRFLVVLIIVQKEAGAKNYSNTLL